MPGDEVPSSLYLHPFLVTLALSHLFWIGCCALAPVSPPKHPNPTCEPHSLRHSPCSPLARAAHLDFRQPRPLYHVAYAPPTCSSFLTLPGSDQPTHFSVWFLLPRPSGNACLAPGFLAGLWVLCSLSSTEPSFWDLKTTTSVAWKERSLALPLTRLEGALGPNNTHTHKVKVWWRHCHLLHLLCGI